MDRSVFRELQPDDRWWIYGVGWVNPKDANQATIAFMYEKDDGTVVQIGTVTQSGSGRVKKSMGPFDIFATAGVPAGETIPIIRLAAIKDAGVDGELDGWVVWVRHLPAK